MKLKSQLQISLIFLFFIPCLLFINFVSSLSPNKASASNNVYSQKIVAVVYDDSASMQTSSRYHYAKYAMQVLMSMLDSNDVLRVFTLNGSDFDVDLTNSNRNNVVQENVNKLTANGGWTKPDKITTAVEWLENEHGLNKYATVEGKEFKLIIMTDGQFNGYSPTTTTSNVVGDRIAGYVGLQTSFFGISLSSNNNKVEDLVAKNSSVKGYYANTATQIVSTMQEITNSTTGRYVYVPDSSAGFNVSNKKKYTVDLSSYDFSISSISVLAQGSGSSVKLNTVNSVTPLTKSRECNLASSSVNLYGYSALLSPSGSNDTKKYLYKEKIELEFASVPTEVLILLEPAIKLSSSLEYYNETTKTWSEITRQEINSNLKVGDKIRTRYKLIDANTDTDLTTTLSNVDVKVSYNKVVYDYNDVITLIQGPGEIALSVAINFDGSIYNLHDSWACDIDADPTHYRVVPTVTKEYNSNVNKVRIDYNIWFEYEFVSKEALVGSNKQFSWSFNITDPNGNKITNYQTDVTDGTITIIFDMDPAIYGDYTVDFQILWEKSEIKKLRANKLVVEKNFKDLIITKSDNLTLTTYELTKNTKTFEFTLTDYGYPIEFNSKYIDYSFTIGGIDCKNSATIQGNKLVFLPNNQLDAQLQKVGSYNVVLKVWDKNKPTTSETATIVFKINKTDVSVTTKTTVGVNGDDNKIKVDYSVYCNNKLVSESDLTGSTSVFNLSNIKVLDPSGQDVQFTKTISGGTISITFNKQPTNYGVYKSLLTIEKIGDNNPKLYEVKVENYISNLQIATGTNSVITVNPYELKRNTKPFEFTVTDKGYPINFNSNLIGYTLKIGGVDVTKYATIIDNKITIVPNTTLPTSLQAIGNYNVVLDVWSLQNSNVKDQETLKFNVVTAPTFKIVPNTTVGVNGNLNKVKIDYTVYYGDKVVSQSDLTGTNPVFKYELVELTDPQGNKITPTISVLGGTISVVYDRTPGNYGVYKSKINVTKIDDNRLITSSTTTDYYISNLIITNGNVKVITVNPYELQRNTDAFEFTVTDNGHPINFNSGLIEYSLKIGGVDVTSYATIVDNKLTIVPNSSLPERLKTVGDYNVILEVYSKQNKNVKSTSSLKFNVVSAPSFDIVPNTTVGVNGDQNKVKIDFTVYYGGKVVSQSDLTGTSPVFKYELVELTDPQGNKITPTISVLGGTISVVYDRTPGNYGVYKSKLNVTKIDDNRLITSSTTTDYYISNLIITNGDVKVISVNKYELQRNTDAFEFTVTDNGHPINFNSGLIGYTIKMGSENISNYVTIVDNKLTFVPNSSLPEKLKAVGDYNVVLEVWSNQNKNVKSESSLKLNILKEPNFTIDSNVISGVNGNDGKVKIEYTVYYDDKIVSESDLTGANAKFIYELVELKDPQGNAIIPTISILGGTIIVEFDRTVGNYGIYKSKINVIKVDDNRLITKADNLEYFISNLLVTNGENKTITLNTYELQRNTKSFEFIVTDNGYPINLKSGLVGFEFKIGGNDLTNYVTVKNNVLTFTPNSSLPVGLQVPANYDVVFNVWSFRDSKINAQSKLVLQILKAPDFNIVPSTIVGVNGDDNKVKINYEVYYNGVVLSETDLTGGLFSWEIVEVTDPNYNSITPQVNIVGGTISLTFDKRLGLYGSYKSKIKVTKVDDNRVITSEVEVKHVITELLVTNGENKEIVLNTYELKRNTKAFEFTLTDKGYPINFNSNLIGYTLKIDGVDVTSSCVIENNILRFTPNTNMPSNLQSIADRNVVLDVWSKNSNAKTQSTLKLRIIKAPNFNIITSVTVGHDGDDNKVKVDYTVYYNDKIVNESDFNGNTPIFSWDIVEVKDPKGKIITPLGSVSGGTISVIFDKTPGNYGVYTAKVNVTKIDDERPIVSEVKVEYYISDLIITKPDDNDISLNIYELKRNTKPFEFSVTDKNVPINFDSGLIGYSLKIGGVDVTSYVVFEGNKLKYVPNSTIPQQLQSIKDYAVVLDVWSTQNPNVKEKSVSQLSIVKAPNFSLTSKSTLGADGDVNKIKVDYTVYYDDKIVSKSQLEDGPNKVFKVGKVDITFSEDKNFKPQYDVVYGEGTISIVFNKLVDKFGVYNVKISVVKIDDDRPVENAIDIDCFITDLKVKKGDNNDISLTTYQLKKNTTAFEFVLTNEDRPINYNSDSIGYTLKIDGLDVTEYAVIENNVLKFIPNLNMPKILQEPKENSDVILDVWSIRNPSINVKAVSKLTIIKSVYVVDVINDDNTSVDIYNLKNCSTKIYYKISVDGNVLSSQEITEGLSDGLIQIDTKPLGWIFLLPTQVNNEIVEYNGINVICLSVGTNWISPLDNLFASFIFTGEKTVSVQCADVVGEGVINLVHVEFLSRLWRWAVIIITIYIIIHILLWIIGFFVAKSLPKGALIQMKLKPENPKLLVTITSELINTEKKEIILWHLQRFIPFNEFKHQDPVSKYGVTLQVDNGDSVIVHNKSRSIVRLNLEDDDISNLVRKWRRSWQEFYGGSRPRLKITTKQLNDLIEDMDKDVTSGSVAGLSENYYATKNKKGKIDTIIFFKYID